MTKKTINPPSKIGIIGGGQLGKMLAAIATQMGYGVWVLDPKQDAPAAVFSEKHICRPFSDKEALLSLAKGTSVLTYEFEHLDLEGLRFVEEHGYRICPSANLLAMIQDKLVQKKYLYDNGIPVPNFVSCEDEQGLKELFKSAEQGVVVKSRRDGYDGKGTWFFDHIDQMQALDRKKFYAEQKILLQKEVSVMVARNLYDKKVYPVAENIHDDGILTQSLVPAKISRALENQVIEIALTVSDVFKDEGLLCIEMFIDENDQIYVNEIAPRAHNTGHYTIEACEVSQYEQWLRILTGMPLGSDNMHSHSAMLNVLGSKDVDGLYWIEGLEEALEFENVHFHFYNKSMTQHRKKIGHITSLDQTTEQALKKAKQALEKIVFKERNEISSQ